MHTLAAMMSRGLRWAFPTTPPPGDGAPPWEQVARAMDRGGGWDQDPHTVAKEQGLLWSFRDEEQWYREYTRCAGCGGWSAVRNGPFCQACLAV